MFYHTFISLQSYIVALTYKQKNQQENGNHEERNHSNAINGKHFLNVPLSFEIVIFLYSYNSNNKLISEENESSDDEDAHGSRKFSMASSVRDLLILRFSSE